MSAEQIDLFDILFPTPKDSICKNLKEAVKNECGVFIEQNVMFQGGSYGEGERVVITIARKSPFIYYSFSCETRIQGRSHPCTENPSSRFCETDSRDCVTEEKVIPSGRNGMMMTALKIHTHLSKGNK